MELPKKAVIAKNEIGRKLIIMNEFPIFLIDEVDFFMQSNGFCEDFEI